MVKFCWLYWNTWGVFHSEELACHLHKLDPNESVVCTVLPLWCGMWISRYLWNQQRRHKVWWVGAARQAWWLSNDQYVWRIVHWIGNGSRKGCLWRRVKVCRFWGKEEFRHHIFGRPGSEWGAIREWSDSKRLSNRWWYMINKKYSNKWMIIIYSLSLCLHVMKLFRLTSKIYLTDAR